MKRKLRLSALALALCLLTGCSALLEGRSYGVVEPYTDRYWDPAAEDTMRVESYQDLVNSLLMLMEQRAEEGVIRYYGDEDPYTVASSARREVCRETMLGAYLIDHMTFLTQWDDGYTTFTFTLKYRKDAEDVDGLMSLSDSQSLGDLLRLALREELERLTVSFPHETESREAVTAVVEEQWRELYLETQAPESIPEDGGSGGEESADAPEDEPPETEEPPGEEGVEPPTEGEPDAAPLEEGPVSLQPEIPPCPWEIRFYPDVTYPGIVEILLTPAGTGGAVMGG